MAQLTANHKKGSIADLQKEVNLLRSFIIGMIKKDKEGKYRSKFVKDVFRVFQEKAEYTFKNKKSFLNHLQKTV